MDQIFSERCEHTETAFVNGRCMICKERVVEESQEFAAFRSKMEAPVLELEGEGLRVRLLRWFRQTSLL